MKSLKDLCRLLLTTQLSNRKIGEVLGLSHNTVARYRGRLAEEGLTWDAIAPFDEGGLDRRLNTGRSQLLKDFVEPDWNHVDAQMRRTGVTITLLHEEYAEGLSAGAMSESEFRRRYARHRRAHGLVMRQIHPPGQSLFIDYSGKRPSLTDPATGEKTPVELFVAVLGASRKTFVRATQSQKLPDFIDAHVRAMQTFGGVTMFWVPDNLKSAVTSHSKGEGALINPTYSECARHYDATPLPARPRKPKDKAPVEVGVLVAQRWILARLRDRVFYSLTELNAAITELVERLNDRPMRTCGGKSRNQLFEELDRSALKPLPPQPYEFAEWTLNVRVGQDYHVVHAGHYYSVPFHLVGAKVNLRASHHVLTVFHGDRRVALHPRSVVIGGITTLPEHRPQAHQAFAQDQPAALLAWAQTQGGPLHQFVQQHVEEHRRPTLSVQACRGLQRLVRDFGLDRVQAACTRAVELKAIRLPSLESMLRRGLETAPLPSQPADNDHPLPPHDNVRGAEYFH